MWRTDQIEFTVETASYNMTLLISLSHRSYLDHFESVNATRVLDQVVRQVSFSGVFQAHQGKWQVQGNLTVVVFVLLHLRILTLVLSSHSPRAYLRTPEKRMHTHVNKTPWISFRAELLGRLWSFFRGNTSNAHGSPSPFPRDWISLIKKLLGLPCNKPRTAFVLSLVIRSLT